MLLLLEEYIFETGVDPWSLCKVVFSFFHVFPQSLHVHGFSFNEGNTVNFHLFIGLLLLGFIEFWFFLFLFLWGIVDAFGWFILLLSIFYFFNFRFLLHFLKSDTTNYKPISMIKSIWDKKLIAIIEMDMEDVADEKPPLPLLLSLSWNNYIGFYYNLII